MSKRTHTHTYIQKDRHSTHAHACFMAKHNARGRGVIHACAHFVCGSNLPGQRESKKNEREREHSNTLKILSVLAAAAGLKSTNK